MKHLIAVVIVATATSAGCEQAIEMRLMPPTGDEVDTSCVTAVELTLTGRLAEEETYYCVEVQPGDVRSLRDHGLDGTFDLALPPFDIIGIQLRGAASPQGCTTGRAVGPTIFVASSDEIDDVVELPMRGVLSCADKLDQPAPVRVVDMESLLADGSCVAVEGLVIQPGELFPTMLYNSYSGVQWWSYFWATPTPTPATGIVDVPYTFSGASSGSCLGLYVNDGAQAVDACLTPAGRGACGAESEFHYIPYTQVRDASLGIEDILTYPNVVFGVVLDRQRRPIAGATITTGSEAVIQYTTPAAGGYARVETSATGASGTFTVLARRPALIEVNVPGMATRRVMAGGDGATVVVMDSSGSI